MLLMERGVAERTRVYGMESAHVQKASEALTLMYNSTAMTILSKGDPGQAIALLDKANQLVTDFPALLHVRVQTLNNLACCYRRKKKLDLALKLLQEALTLCDTLKSIDGATVTHLNMCAILAQMKRHIEAVEHAKAAVLLCQEQLLSDSIRKKIEQHEPFVSSSFLTERVVILGIAYHNLGVEEEYLHHYDDCLQWYLKALRLAKKHIGKDAPITKSFRTSFRAAKQIMERRKVSSPQKALDMETDTAAAKPLNCESRPLSAASTKSSSLSRPDNSTETHDEFGTAATRN